MTNEERRPIAVIAKSRAEEVREQALAAMEQATSALEAEASALKKLEEAHLRAEEATAEAKSATAAETAARLEMKQAQDRAKRAFVDAEKATQLEDRANKARERKDDKLRVEEARVAEAGRSGKQPNLTARDEARQGADEAGMTAMAALRGVEKAREAAAVANKEVNEAQGRAVEASTRTFTAKEAEAAAKKGVAEAEHDAKKAVAEAQVALEVEADAKKAMDWAISKLKALKLHHANAGVGEAVVERTGYEPQQAGESGQTMSSEDEGTVGQPAAEKAAAGTFSGLIRLVVTSPVDHTSMRRLRERLEQIEGFRVGSVSGSSATGASITVSTERPFPLLPWLSASELVERVSMRGRHIEVTLRPTPQDALNTDLEDPLGLLSEVPLPDGIPPAQLDELNAFRESFGLSSHKSMANENNREEGLVS